MNRYDHLIGTTLASGEWSWDADKTLLYAVGIGAGLGNPLEERQFTTENTPGVDQQVVPTFLALMVKLGNWTELLGWSKQGLSPVGVVHGEQSVTLERPIPVRGNAHLSTVLSGIYDKRSGALLTLDTHVALDDGEHLGTTRMSLFAIGKGGFGGPSAPADEQPWHQQGDEPDVSISYPVGLNQSLIYRLSGDRHPHGTDPGRAHADGFDQPIFYGLGSFGYACRALINGLCAGDAARFGHMQGRFSKPVYPGDRLDTLIWRTEAGAVFRMLANGERVVLDRGVFRFHADEL